MKKRILSIILTVAMIVCMIPLGMVTVYAGYYVSDTATLQSYGTNGGDAYIASSSTFNLTGAVTVAAGKKLYVDLHGGYLAPTGNFTSFIVYGTLILKNSSTDGGCIDGVKKPSGSNTPLIEVRDGGTVWLDDNSSKGNVDLKNNYYDWGGAVIVRKGGNFVMGAKAQIYKCTAKNGGGVLIESGRFTMYGGKIPNCSA
ncbi:MAG: hypothetical protein MJ053_07700, partial [Elusimicrobiaceae bacterium]|nr:hypothetical protein [Elusimicrobiaceae bacterium]